MKSVPNTNVLVTSAGRRVRLVQNFQEAMERRIPSGKVLAIDLNPATSAACRTADASYPAPRVDDEGYLDFLLEFCRDKKVGLVVPTIDPELPVLARARERFASSGVVLAVSTPAVCDAFHLKTSTEKHFFDHGIDTPRLY
jgi:carbamoyl-phosphate synthase large subunit